MRIMKKLFSSQYRTVDDREARNERVQEVKGGRQF